MREARTSAWVVGAVAVVIVLLGLGFGLGRVSRGSSGKVARSGAVQSIDGVQVGVLDTRGGALAAADTYVASSLQTVLAQPEAFKRMVNALYVPGAAEKVLAEAERERNAAASRVAALGSGWQTVVVIGARRLDAYSPGRAQVTTWAVQALWGPEATPRQNWYLINTHLRWEQGAWRVEALTPLSGAPVPARVLVNNGETDSEAFTRLSGMTAPAYGAP